MGIEFTTSDAVGRLSTATPFGRLNRHYPQNFSSILRDTQKLDKLTFTSMVRNRDADTPFPFASIIIGASPARTEVTKKAVLLNPRAGTVTRNRRNNSISAAEIVMEILYLREKYSSDLMIILSYFVKLYSLLAESMLFSKGSNS